ncbi:unnamed protein product [Staurois parvus]|uniref:Uncharacterized protein n=1 Tax=Staurois parvus TaxID=386267 RepID=A0ABN9AUP4_9NEOB|nr:unnamed protein product [Staurois parvus]
MAIMCSILRFFEKNLEFTTCGKPNLARSMNLWNFIDRVPLPRPIRCYYGMKRRR